MRIYLIELQHLDDYSQPDPFKSYYYDFARILKEANKIKTKKKIEGLICEVIPIDLGRDKMSFLEILNKYAA